MNNKKLSSKNTVTDDTDVQLSTHWVRRELINRIQYPMDLGYSQLDDICRYILSRENQEDRSLCFDLLPKLTGGSHFDQAKELDELFQWVKTGQIIRQPR